MAVEIKINDAELRQAAAKVKALGAAVTVRQRKAVLRKGARILQEAAKVNVPVSDRPTVIYRTAKLDSSRRAPKGQGVISVTLPPGTLRDDINIKSLRRSPDLFVGAGTRSKVLAFFAHFEEFGTRHREGSGFMLKSYNQTKGAIVAELVKGFGQLFDRTIKKLSK